MLADHSKRLGIWSRNHYLDKMTLKDLTVAYFQYYAIQAYLVLAVASIVFAFYNPPATVWQGVASSAVTFVIYPVVWYLLHRWVLHGQWMYKNPLTSPAWKRIHYDHHQDPNHLEVLFGALYTTLPTIAVATIPVGWLIGDMGGAAICFATGLLVTCAYEYVHCIQHLSYKPKNKLLVIIKKRHMEHHFHDENGNYGIISLWPDRLFGTLYEREQRPKKSPTVFNLGYTDEVAQTYPWVSKLSGGVAKGHPRQRDAAKTTKSKDAA